LVLLLEEITLETEEVTVVVSEEVSEEETTNKNNTKYFTQKRVAIELQPFSM
jgi:hypothetical protein